jgi:hypothetical protein
MVFLVTLNVSEDSDDLTNDQFHEIQFTGGRVAAGPS